MTVSSSSLTMPMRHQNHGWSSLSRLALVFTGAFTCGFIGWWLAGYDQLHTAFAYHFDYRTMLSVWSGIVVGMLASAIYGLYSGYKAVTGKDLPQRARWMILTRHGLACCVLVLLTGYVGLLTAYSADSQLEATGYGEDAYTYEIHHSRLHGQLFTDDLLFQEAIDAYAAADEEYTASVINLHYPTFTGALFALGMAFLYSIGIMLYMDGVRAGRSYRRGK